MLRVCRIVGMLFVLCRITSAAEPTIPTAIDEAKYQLPDADLSIPAWAGKRSDEPFPVRAFLESRMPPEQNAAPYYLFAFSQYTSGFVYLHPDAEQETYLERTQAFEKEVAEFSFLKWLSVNGGMEEAEAFLAKCEPFLKLIDQAQQRPKCLFVSSIQEDSLLPHAQAGPTLARLAVIEIAYASAKSDFARAEKALQRALRMSRDLRPRGILFAQLVSILIERDSTNAVLQHYLSRDEVTVEDCDRLLKILLSHRQQSLQFGTEGLQMDYVVCGTFLEGLRSVELSRKEITPSTNALLNKYYDVEWKTLNELFRLSLTDIEQPGGTNKNANRINERYWELEEKVLGAPRSATPALDEVPDLVRAQIPEYAIGMFPILNQSLEALTRQQVRSNGILLMTAVRRYQLKNAKLPSTLQEALQEVGIPDVPPDPYDGAPMRYVVLDGKPVVYSVGADLIDQGGMIDWTFGKRPGDFLFRFSE